MKWYNINETLNTVENQESKNIITEKKITEEDLYFLSHIEGLKSTAGIFKEKYNKFMYEITNKYNVDSLEFLFISKYVREHKFHLRPELVEKYGPYNLDESRISFIYKGNNFYIIMTGLVLLIWFFTGSEPSYCECKDISKTALMVSSGLSSDGVDFDGLEDCNSKIIKDLELDMSPGKMGISYTQQVSYEMCTYGYYEGRNGTRYYPK